MAEGLKVRGTCGKCGRTVTTTAPKGRLTWRGPCPKKGCGARIVARRLPPDPAGGGSPTGQPADQAQQDPPAPAAKSKPPAEPAPMVKVKAHARAAPRGDRTPPKPVYPAAEPASGSAAGGDDDHRPEPKRGRAPRAQRPTEEPEWVIPGAIRW